MKRVRSGFRLANFVGYPFETPDKTQHFIGLAEIVGEPLLRNLADDPRYKAFLRKMELPDG